MPTMDFQVNFIFKSNFQSTVVFVKTVIIKSLIGDFHIKDGELSSNSVQFPFAGSVTRTVSRAIVVIVFGSFECCFMMKKYNPVCTATSLIFVPSDLRV